MRTFSDMAGSGWIATAREEDTPRHHGRWYLIIHPAGDPDRAMPMPEVRWQTRASAARTLATMSPFELRRRLHVLLERDATGPGGTAADSAEPRTPDGGGHTG